MESRKSKHKSSILLSFEENNVIFGKLAKGDTALSTAIVQLVLSSPPDHTRWQLFNTGVMIFVKSNRSRTYYFRLYDFKEYEKLWEQEIYLNIIYSALEPRFHTFEAEDYMAGLNFADQTEAKDFLFVVKQKIQLLSEMFGEKEKDVIKNNTNIISNTKSNSLNVPEVTLNKSISLESLNTKKKRFKLKKKLSKKLTKEEKKLEIGLPTNFKHIQHIGWSPSTGFEFNVIDQKLNNFFSLAGISENQLQDSETRKFIFDFISSNGGIETAIQESVKTNEKTRDKKSSESRVKIISSNPNENHPIFPPPPPPLSTTLPPTPPQPPLNMVGPPPPPPPPMPFTSLNDENISNDLISNQKEIKVNQQKVGSDRNELLEQIRGGIRLKKAESTKERSNESTNYESSGNPLASALSKALQNRFRVNQMNDYSSDSSEEKNEETKYNEWSD